MAFFADTDLLLSCLIILPYNLCADKEALLQLQQCICSLLPFSPSVLHKDSAYYMRLLKEQESEKGGILIAEQDGEMRGILVFEEDGLAVREPLLRKGYEDVFDKAGVILQKEEKKKPLIMARLLNVESLLSSMVCKEEMDLEFVLYDPIIRENNCLFMLKGNEEHLVVRTRTAHTGKDDAVQKISIDAFTSIVFGYKELEKIEEEEKEIFSAEFKEEISKLMPFSPVFINEIV